MNVRRLTLYASSLAAAAGATFLLGLQARIDATPPVSAGPPPIRALSSTDAPPEPRPLTARQWQAALGGEPETTAATERTPEAAPPAPVTGAISMPIAEKLVSDQWTAVPHELIGAWDDAPGSSRPGAHRTIVAVVDRAMPSGELEQLVWDLRESHSAAEVLDVRVYDSAEAASSSTARDGGAERQRHLVAEVKRNDRLGFDQTTVLGRVVGP